MLGEQATKKKHAYLKKTLAKLKGHAVPLFGYHILREHILKEIAGEYQGSILYWAGKNLSTSFLFPLMKNVLICFPS